MKDFELSHDAATKLEEQAEKIDADKGEDSQDGDSVEQTLDVPTERSEDEAAELVQKQYKEKSGLELDGDSARDIVSTARDGGESSDSGAASEADSGSDSDSEDDAPSKKESAKAESSRDADH